MNSNIKKSVFCGAVIGLAAILVAFDLFVAVMISAHGFPTEIFKSDYPNWRRRVVFTWWDGLILVGLCLGHLFVGWAYLRHRSRRIRVGPNAGYDRDVRL